MPNKNLKSVATFTFCLTLLFACKKEDNTVVAKSSEKGIKSFIFNELTPAVVAKIDTSAKTITINLPPATDPSNLRPTIELYSDKSTISPSSLTVKNFISTQTYVVTAENGTVANYSTILKKPTATSKDVPSAPKQLCIYYAWPSTVNGSGGNTNNAINVFKNFDVIVFGDGIWKTTHGDNLNTKTIISGLKAAKPSIKIFGYIDVSTTIQNLSEAQLKAAIDGWQQMGVNGVFGDDFGSDFGVNRSRQNVFIDYAHSKGLSVFANSWNIEDALGGSDCHLTGTNGDFYLMESYFISDGNYSSLSTNISKANSAYYYMKNKGVGIACVARDLSNNVSSTTNQSDKFKQSWHATAMFNFDAFQYTNKNFCSQNEYLFNFPNFITSYGTSWTDYDWVRKVSDTRYERTTNTTTFYITGDGTTNGTGGH